LHFISGSFAENSLFAAVNTSDVLLFLFIYFYHFHPCAIICHISASPLPFYISKIACAVLFVSRRHFVSFQMKNQVVFGPPSNCSDKSGTTRRNQLRLCLEREKKE